MPAPRWISRGAAAAVAAAAIAAIAVQPAAAAPGAELAPIKGVGYQPAPSDYQPCASCAYFDTDFFNSDFTELWSSSGSGRGDLAAMQSLGANLVRLYNWNPQRNHLAFLNEAQRHGIRVVVPISNYFVLTDASAIPAIVREVYVDAGGAPSTTPHPAVVAWTVGNEVDLEGNNSDPNVRRANLAKVADATAALVKAESALGATRRLPVSSPVSFATFNDGDPAFSATRTMLDVIRARPELGDAFIGSRFFAAVQTFNDGHYLHDWLTRFAQAFPDTSVWFSELGVNTAGSCGGFTPPCTPSEDQQAAYIAAQWREAPPGAAGGAYLGGVAFEFIDEPWKGGTEATFGLAKFATPASHRQVGGYRVDTLAHKPAWDAFRDPVNGVRLLTADADELAGLEVDSRDLVALDEATGMAEVRFDGSEAGLREGTGIDAVTVDPRDGSLLMTFSAPQRLKGVGRVGASDVVRAAGPRLAVALRADAVGLGGRGGDIDALAVDRRGRLVVSTTGSFRGGGTRFAPHDLAVLRPARAGRHGAARWAPYLRGADVGLTRPGENVDGAWIDPRNGAVHLSTTGRFAAGGVRGSGADVLVRRPDGGVHLGWRAAAAGVTASGAEGVARDVR